MSLRVYVGPILVVPRKKVLTEYTVDTCNNKSCSNYHREGGPPLKFCGFCGKPIQVVTKEQVSIEPSSVYELLRKNEFSGDTFGYLDRTNDQQELILPPNKIAIGERNLYFDGGYSLMKLSYKDMRPGEEMAWFASTYEKEIALIQSNFENCVIDWAIVNAYPF